MTIKKYDTSAIDLAEVDFGNYTGECTFDDGIASGVLLNVSSWVRNEMNFGKTRYSVEVAVTAHLWKTIVRTPVGADPVCAAVPPCGAHRPV